MSELTVSEEQVLHNELSFEINQELIHLMKRIVEIQRVNKQLKEVIEEVRKYVDKEMFDYLETPGLLQILDKVK
jgi:hypothetical protein